LRKSEAQDGWTDGWTDLTRSLGTGRRLRDNKSVEE